MTRQTAGVLTVPALLPLIARQHRDDPPPPPNTVGVYTYVEINNGVDTVLILHQLITFRVDTVLILHQLITFRFAPSDFTVSLPRLEPDSSREFCDIGGTYELGTGVELLCDLSNWPDSCGEADIYPCGRFGIDQTTDTMCLLNDVSDSLGVRRVRELRLVLAD